MTAQAGDTSNFRIADDKQALRSACRARRRALTASQRRHAERTVVSKLLRRRVIRNAHAFGVYLAVGSELSTTGLIRALLRLGKSVYAPVTMPSGGMRFIRLRTTGAKRRDPMGFPRPAAHRPQQRVEQLDVLIIPLLAFDRRGQRLGQGGGFYDRALAMSRKQRKPLRLGFAFPQQEIPIVPSAAWDVPLHAVVTANGFRRF